MSSLSFIEFYENEMNYLMEEGKRFKEKYPNMGNLDFSNTSCDPDVKRLIESVAFLNATLNKRIEEKNPELNQEILNSIYPHFNRPTPSFCIFHLENPEKQFIIKNGAKILSRKSNGIKYSFTATHSIKISSYNIINIKKSSTNNLPKHIGKIADSSIEISLGKTFNQPENEMVLFINSLDDFPDSLYESLFTFYKNQNTPVFENDVQIGEIFQMNDFDIFPTQDNENDTFKSIIEFNAFKQKLLFFKIKFQKEPMSKIIIPISNNKKLNIKQNSFLLNCFVGVNIVEQISDPINVDNTNHKYSIRVPKNHEIYTIKEIKSVENHKRRYINYFSLEYNEKTEDDILWITKKTEISKIKTDLYLLNNDFKKHVLYAKTLCVQTNANNDIDSFEDWIIPELGCSCTNIKKPTKYYSNMNHNDTQRTLISHLFINYFGLDNDDMLKKLKELFNLYSNNDNINHYFSLIHEISTETNMIPIKGNMIPKVYIIMKVKDDPDLFLLAQVIAKTLSNNINLNSKLALTLIKSDTNEVWKQCDII